MDTFALLAQGLVAAFEPMNLLYALIGVTIGTAVGVLPGIGPALTVALLLPATYKLDPAGSLIMFAGIYYGAMYGGSTTSILLNTPGESATVVTALEGNKMARPGRAGRRSRPRPSAPSWRARSGRSGLAFVAVWVVQFALKVGPAAYFALMVLASSWSRPPSAPRPLRGLTALFARAPDRDGRHRPPDRPGALHLREIAPLDGIEVHVVAVALFAVGETLYMAGRRYAGRRGRAGLGLGLDDEDGLAAVVEALAARHRHRLPDRRDARGGAEIASSSPMRSSGRLSRHKEEFGTTGAIEGVAGPEAANNASSRRHARAAPDARPADHGDGRDHACGLPAASGSSRGRCSHQTQAEPRLGPDRQPAHRERDAPGPQPADDRALGADAEDPRAAGSTAASSSSPRSAPSAPTRASFELGLLLAFGLLGYGLRRFGYPIAPVVVGLILGPLAEQQLRRALAISQGEVLYTLALAALLLPLWLRLRGRGAALSKLASDED
jgi:putative tricarboxylic transport membrane protein